MTVLLWIFAAVVALLIGRPLLHFATAVLVPRRISGALLLTQELKERGIATRGLPQQFFDDCIQWAEGVARMKTKDPTNLSNRGSTADFVEVLQNLAWVAAQWVRERATLCLNRTNLARAVIVPFSRNTISRLRADGLPPIGRVL